MLLGDVRPYSIKNLGLIQGREILVEADFRALDRTDRYRPVQTLLTLGGLEPGAQKAEESGS